MMRILFVVTSLLFETILLRPATADDDLDYAALPSTDGKDIAYLLCSDCHSMQNVMQYRFSRAGWRRALERMTNDFGMVELESDEKILVLDYLTRHFQIGMPR